MSELIETLEEAQHEINSLRRRNEILSAKVEVMESFMCVLHTSPAQHTQTLSPDVVFQLEKHLEKLKGEAGTPPMKRPEG